MKIDWKCIASLAFVMVLSACIVTPLASANSYGGGSGGGGYGYDTGSYQKYTVSNYGGDSYACYNACVGDGTYPPNQCKQWCNYYPKGY